MLERFGSPLFVFSGAALEANLRGLKETLEAAGARLYLAGKANPNPYLWKRLTQAGIDLDACSPGEVDQALKLGLPPERISFTGCGLTRDEMDQLAKSQVEVNFDAADQAWAFTRRHPKVEFGLRVNPGQGAGSHDSCTTAGSEAKLGIPWHQVEELIRDLRAAQAPLGGLHCHTGSGGLDAHHFREIAKRMAELADRSGPWRYLSLGGGIGVPHHPKDPSFDLALYAEAIEALRDRPYEIRLEPGQAFMANPGLLACEVVSTKSQADGFRFAMVNSSFNHYLGTSLYGSYHQIEVDAPRAELASRPQEPVHVVGHLCNTGDVFARARPLPRLEVGDRLVLATCGAYGLSRAANYNSRTIPAEVFVEGEKAFLIRRRQTYEDLRQWYCEES